jgi:hypothetical protein
MRAADGFRIADAHRPPAFARLARYSIHLVERTNQTSEPAVSRDGCGSEPEQLQILADGPKSPLGRKTRLGFRITTKLSDRRRKRPVGCNSREQIT